MSARCALSRSAGRGDCKWFWSFTVTAESTTAMCTAARRWCCRQAHRPSRARRIQRWVCSSRRFPDKHPSGRSRACRGIRSGHRRTMADTSPFEPADWLQREDELLGPLAIRSRQSTGGRYPEPPHLFRAPFQRDRDRIVHCTAFRRLMHKTQVLLTQTSDHHRTRLTHTLEVSQIARTIARRLGLNEDL